MKNTRDSEITEHEKKYGKADYMEWERENIDSVMYELDKLYKNDEEQQMTEQQQKQTALKLLELLDEYYDRFGDAFPTMNFQNATDEILIELVQKCLDNNVKQQEDLTVKY